MKSFSYRVTFFSKIKGISFKQLDGNQIYCPKKNYRESDNSECTLFLQFPSAVSSGDLLLGRKLNTSSQASTVFNNNTNDNVLKCKFSYFLYEVSDKMEYFSCKSFSSLFQKCQFNKRWYDEIHSLSMASTSTD